MQWVFLIVMLSLATVTLADDQTLLTEQIVPLENFEQYPPQAFPNNWKVRGDEEAARIVYRVAEEDGNHFLHARAEKQAVQIGLTKTFRPKQFPVLQWRWRVQQLPVGANERALKTNDSAAGVYVVFDSTIVPRVIKYVWSSSLPVGTQVDSPVYWRAKVVVLESGVASASEWRKETVNFYEDYKKFFGFEPGEVEGVALLTDSDTTATVAEADYDDFTLMAASDRPPHEATALLSMPRMLGQ
ncbi:MAG: DUF3047 domain-containing protein [Candidatus Binatia bacterium]